MTHSTRFRFTKAAIDRWPTPDKRTRIRDEALPGLILELSPSGTRTFRVYKKRKGDTTAISVTLGRYPGMTIEQARKAAIEALKELNSGANPNEEARVRRKARITLREVYADYANCKGLKESTRRGYDTNVRTYLNEFADRPLSALDESAVKRLHQSISRRSPAQADLVMRFARALFNFAKYEYRGPNGRFLFEHNPIAILNHQKLWNRVPRRNTCLTRGQLPGWFDALDALRGLGPYQCAVCDLAEVALLTGLRRSELMELTWAQVNLDEGRFFISRTKNGEPLELPITTHLDAILRRRRDASFDHLGFVFNAPNALGRLQDPRKALSKIAEHAGVGFTLHDLRRTFTTTAESLNVGTYTIKRLLNHRTRRDDVTAGYLVLTPEELRQPAQRIADAIMTHAGRFDAASGGMDAALEALVAGLSEADKRRLIFDLSAQQRVSEAL
ncbi:tyrosine-type recombinase/integrase [Chromatocurvus halotolerans]|uniref:Site-specific recombinase XerD n=1 Tax=Chromatocurvus halotolerans TaxID=1132028 RepID=A0A4R2KK57_9GAMM|nr:integrase family protein [Chromatocurvus halotolerans]TCO73704.1 site-specific recombinase XerD [Chromatocurvus halotolerans]